MGQYLVVYDLGYGGSTPPPFNSVQTRNGKTNKSKAETGFPAIGHAVAVEAESESEAAETVRLTYQGASQNYLIAPLNEVFEVGDTHVAYVQEVTAQTAEGVAAPVFALTPKTAGFEPFQVLETSNEGEAAGAGTFNHAMFFGWNAARHGNPNGTGTFGPTNEKPCIYMGFEDNYYDTVAKKFGAEWYVGVASKDGSTLPVTKLRPFYTRFVNESNANAGAQTFCEIGTDGTGEWKVQKQVGEPLFAVTPTVNVSYKPLTMSGATSIIEAPLLMGNAEAAKNLYFRCGGSGGTVIFQNGAISANNLTISDTGVLGLRDGASLSNFGTGFTVGAAATQKVGFWGVTPVEQRKSWALATEAVARTTFKTQTANVKEVAERLGALIEDLKTIGIVAA